MLGAAAGAGASFTSQSEHDEQARRDPLRASRWPALRGGRRGRPRPARPRRARARAPGRARCRGGRERHGEHGVRPSRWHLRRERQGIERPLRPRRGRARGRAPLADRPRSRCLSAPPALLDAILLATTRPTGATWSTTPGSEQGSPRRSCLPRLPRRWSTRPALPCRRGRTDRPPRGCPRPRKGARTLTGSRATSPPSLFPRAQPRCNPQGRRAPNGRSL